MQSTINFLKSDWQSVLLVALILFVGLAIGYILEKLFIKYFAKLAVKTKWKGDNILIESFHKIFTLSVLLFTTYIITKLFKIDPVENRYLEKVMKVSIVILITWYFARATAKLGELYFVKLYGVQASSLVNIIAKGIVFSIGGMFVLQTLGISIAPMLTALGVGGLAVALALKDTLANFFSGIQILATQSFRVGDFIEIDENLSGYITDITWRNVTLKTIYDNLIIIPNATFSQSKVLNYNFPQPMYTTPITIGVHYESNLEKVEQVTKRIAQAAMDEFGGFNNPQEPIFRFHSFNSSSIDFDVRLKSSDYHRHFQLKHEFIKRLQLEFQKENIEIPFPIQNIYFRNTLPK